MCRWDFDLPEGACASAAINLELWPMTMDFEAKTTDSAGAACSRAKRKEALKGPPGARQASPVFN
jgi:hypothetical protein